MIRRRTLLLSGGGAAVVLGVGATLGWRSLRAAPRPATATMWVRFDRGRLVLLNPAVEMGQGASTALARLLAQALDADWATVDVVDTPFDDAFGNPRFGGRQVTADSSSTGAFAPLLREAGQRLRGALVAAAARQWQCAPAGLYTQRSVVHHPDGRSLGYAALAPHIGLDDDVPGLPPPRARLVGEEAARVDLEDKILGRARYGVDLRPPQVPVALLLRGPSHGARPTQVVDQTALQVSGVLRVLVLDDAVAVVGRDTWAALQGRRALQVHWAEDARAAAYDSEAELQRFARLAAEPGDTGRLVHHAGAPAEAWRAAPRRLEATYLGRHVTHACIEPLNAMVTPTAMGLGAQVLASTQAPSLDMRAVARAYKAPPPLVSVQRCLVGGGFGRRVDNSAAADAGRIARALGGPVQALWLPGDDIAHGQVRSIAAVHLQAALDERGRLQAWQGCTVADSTIARMFPDRFEREGQFDQTVADGLDLPYACAHQRLSYRYQPTGLPNGFLRGVGAGFNVFAIESFIDEIAAAAGQDALAWRLAHLGGERERRVLQHLAEACGWGRSQAPALGLAFMVFRGTVVAMAAQVETTGDGGFAVARLWASVDCGQVVLPDAVRAQVEGAAVMGVAFALREVLHVRGGRRSATSLSAYAPLRMHEAPRVEVALVPGDTRAGPQGVGEVGLPPVAPAIANALFRLDGRRRRSLPLRPDPA